MGWLDKFFGGGDEYEKGQDQLDKYYTEGQNYLKPYNDFGQQAHGDLSGAMKRLLNPMDLEAEWTNAYHESPAAIQAEKAAQQHGLNAANAMGLNGSNTALQAIQGGTSRIGMADRDSWLNRLMQKYMTGTGIAQNIFNTGAGTAGMMANNATNMGNNSAQMSYGQEAAGGDSMFTNLLSKGLGWAAGGPIGAGVGSKISDWMLGGK